MQKLFSKIYKPIIIAMFLLPLVSFAQTENILCSKKGYTVETVNGIFTNEKDAGENRDALAQRLRLSSYHGEPLTVDFFLNKTHKLLDITDTAIQKTFEGVDMWDPDFIKMLNDASTQVRTQKVLLVAHSQGNFYANNVYKVVTDNGDVSKKSIGVYGVASPASYVAGDGRHLTSSTDKVISFLVENVLPGTIAPTNDTIDYKWSDDPMGHDFAKVYLEYRPKTITDDIKWSLDQLSTDPTHSENTPCIKPPKELSTLIKTIRPAVYAVETAFVVVATTATTGKNIAVGTTIGTYHLAVNTAVWTYNTSIATAVWTYNTTVAVGGAVTNTAVAVASTISAGVTSLVNGTGNLAANNGAAVILATQTQAQTQGPQTLPPVVTPPSSTQDIPSKTLTAQMGGNEPLASVQPVQTTILSTTKPSPPKLVFVGMFGAGFGGGGGAPPQVLGTTVVVNEIPAEPDVESDGGSGSGIILQTPALSIPQCSYSLATSTDGCLLATTTIHFEWASVSGATYYAINKNGTYATTTEIGTDITAPDFSDYTFEVSAVGTNENKSATSTKIVSVATIPIAINEIAWMGTVASTSAEWIEIKNNTGHTIDLSQWALASSDSKPFIVLTGTIAPHEYRVLERWLDATVADATAGQVYGNGGTQWALENSGEQLNLSYASTTLDQTPSGVWVAGENSTTTRKTMERYSSRVFGTDASNWGTNLGYIKNGTDAEGNAIAGTPGAQNSVSTLINKGLDITSDLTLTTVEERYVIAGTMNVSASSTLTIAPGVNIVFYEENWVDSAELDVYGALNVSGTPESPVTFNSLTSTPVGSIELFGNSTSTITSAHFDTTYAGVNIYGGSLEISDSTFSNVKYEAVGVYSGSVVSVASTTISNTTRGDAIGVYGNSTLEVASTTIDGALRGSGIYVSDSTLSIASSTIRNVDDSGLLLSNASSTISSVTIENAGWTGIDIYEGTATIIDTDVSGVTGWAGISVSAPTAPVAIIGGEVTGNTRYGVSTSAGSVSFTDVSVHDNGTDYKVW